MPARYPDVYPELFTGLDTETTLRVLQAVGSTHDGRLKSAAEVSRVIEQVCARTSRLRPDATTPLDREVAS